MSIAYNVRSIKGEILEIKLDGDIQQHTVALLKEKVAELKETPVDKIIIMNAGKKIKNDVLLSSFTKSSMIIYHISRKVQKADNKQEVKQEVKEIVKEDIPEVKQTDIIQQRLESAGLIETKSEVKIDDIDVKLKEANVSYLLFKIHESKSIDTVLEELSKIDISVPLIIRSLSSTKEHRKMVLNAILIAHYDTIIKLLSEKQVVLNFINKDDYHKLKYAFEELQFDQGILIDLYNRCNKNSDQAILFMSDVMFQS